MALWSYSLCVPWLQNVKKLQIASSLFNKDNEWLYNTYLIVLQRFEFFVNYFSSSTSLASTTQHAITASPSGFSASCNSI